MNFQYLLVEEMDGALVITLNREDKMNALNQGLLSELKTVIERLYGEEKLKGAVITGKGNKAFAAGADISEFMGLNAEAARILATKGHTIFNMIEDCPKPIVALVNGFALGGGCELAMACHIRLATETARFGQPEVNLGIIPGYGGTQRMTQLIGKGRAFELLMTAQQINAQEAYRMGLVNQVIHAENMLLSALELIDKIASKAPLAIAKVIASVNAAMTPGVNGMEAEIENFVFCTTTEDFKEGTAAFLEKRKPAFQHK